MAHFPEEGMLFCCGLEDQHKLLTNNQSYSRTEIFLEELQSIFTDNIDKLPSLVFLDNLQKPFSSTFTYNIELIIHSSSINDKDKYLKDTVTA